MSSIYLAFSVVFPMLCMMVLGYFLRAINLFNTDLLTQMNRICFNVFLPLLLFVNVYQSDFTKDFSVYLVGFAVVSCILCCALLIYVVPIFERDNQRKGVMIQSIFRSNYVIFGIPITASLFGESNVGTTAILIAFIIPLFNALSVITLEIFAREQINLQKIVIGIIKNPLIIAALLAFFFVLTGIQLPDLFEKTIVDISKVSTPLALIILGGSFALSNVKSNIKPIFIGVAGKLIVVPLIFVPISILFGFKGIELAALFAMFASPTAVSSFTMAESMNMDSQLAGEIVVMNSAFSMITIFIWITILHEINLI